MAEFQPAFEYAIANEGGLSKNPHDTGGTTNYGISAEYLKTKYPHLSPEKLTLDEARVIYYNDFWKRYRCSEIENQIIANKIFELFVNLSYDDAAKLIQRALEISQPDGVIGSHTLKLLNENNPDTLLLELKARQCDFYAHLILKKPDQILFSLGWFRRAVRP